MPSAARELSEMTRCPVCDESESRDTVERKRLPAMQNYVYRTRPTAKAAPQGQLTLTVCNTCGFAWNRMFEPELLVYDAGYDNAVPSAAMDAYYRELAVHLRDRYDLEGGLLVDVGCGNGAFLRAICDVVPGARGLGIDPALDCSREVDGGPIVLIKDVFSSRVIQEQPALIVSRHVLEHIPQPVSFLRTIREAVAGFDPCPCFFEVPDLEWILATNAFWDFAYEHCNYFTAASFAEALGRAGLASVGSRLAFGAQYLWLEALSSRGRLPATVPVTGGGLIDQTLVYAAGEAARVGSMQDRLRRFKRDGFAIAVWGMATKGVLFSLLVDPDASLIDFCIDVNTNKQGCYVPLTGHTISAPIVLRQRLEGRAVVVLVMNENYRDEIRLTCREMGVDPTLVNVSSGLTP